MFHSRQLHLFLAAFALVMSTGCAIKTPQYNASLDNIEQLKKSPAAFKTGSFSV